MASTALDLSDPYLFSKLLADHQSFENKKLLNRFVCIGDATVPYPATESQSEEPKIKIHSSRIEFVDRDLFKPAIAHEWDRGVW